MKKNVKNPPKWATYCITAGLLAVAAGIMMPLLLGLGNGTYKWVYAAGALVSLAGRVAGGYRGSEVRLKRLYRMEAWSSVMFCAGAFFLFYGTAPRDWIAFTLAGGLIIVFTSWRIPREINKLQRNEGGKANK